MPHARVLARCSCLCPRPQLFCSCPGTHLHLGPAGDSTRDFHAKLHQLQSNALSLFVDNEDVCQVGGQTFAWHLQCSTISNFDAG